MRITISTSQKEQTFSGKDFITIGGNEQFDFYLDLGFEYMLTVEVENGAGKFSVLNNFKTEQILFKGKPLEGKLSFEKLCKLLIKDSSEFISIKLSQDSESSVQNLKSAQQSASPVKTKLESQKTEIDKHRVAIVKQIAFSINDLGKRLSSNFRAAIIINIALFMSSVVTAFGITNYLMGLPVTESGTFLNMPTNIKVLGIFSVIVFGIALTLKQGIFMMLQAAENGRSSKLAYNFMIFISAIFFVAFYAINLIYYMNPNGRIVFALLISAFFTMIEAALAISAGYFKFSGHKISKELDKYEFREDFEIVLNGYQIWIERFINSLSDAKLHYIREKIFMLRLKGAGEIIIGILTAPFLAYGVSNTLAMCFPEAAGWVRISGLRFSPVFLILATMLIIFAFFSFVNAFLCAKKISGSNVIKLDGYRDYLSHGTDIYGLENTRKIKREEIRSFIIGIAIIFIEFSMNTSYFMTEIGGDFNGIFLSLIAALVPTALLIAETYLLAGTNYSIYAADSLISKLDK